LPSLPSPPARSTKRGAHSSARPRCAPSPNLSEDAARDRGLSRGLAQSYYRLSGIEKRLGDARAAVAHLHSALAILRSIGDDCCGPPLQRKRYIDCLIAAGPENNGWRHARVQLASLRSRVLRDLAGKNERLTLQAIDAQRQAYAMARDSAAANPRDIDVLDLAATMAGRLANRLINLQRTEESLAIQREAAALIDQMVAIDPANRRNLYLRAKVNLLMGYNLSQLARWRPSQEALLQGEESGCRALAQDPDDVRVLQTQNGILMFLTRVERNLGHLEVARGRCRQALASAQKLIHLSQQAQEPVTMIAVLHEEARLLGVPDTTLPTSHE